MASPIPVEYDAIERRIQFQSSRKRMAPVGVNALIAGGRVGAVFEHFFEVFLAAEFTGVEGT